MKISIVIPTYNQADFIEETILSIINQDYKNIELIIYDGGSTDNTIEILKKYDKYITFWKSERDKGQTHAINKGFEKCTGEIIAWINSDDFYVENTFSKINDFFEKNKAAMWVAGNVLFMNTKNVIYIRKHPNTNRLLEKFGMMSVYQPSVFLRRAVLSNVGYLNQDFHMPMDMEWYCRIAKNYKLYTLDFDFSVFRWQPESKSIAGKGTERHNRYLYEKLQIIKISFPVFQRLFDKYPNLTLIIFSKIGSTLRFIRRLYRFELFKLNDNTNLMNIR